MVIQESRIHVKQPEQPSRFATLPAELQLEIRRYLERGDFISAKALYDASLKLNDEY